MGIWVHGGVSHVVSVFEKGCKKVSWCVGLEEHFDAWLANDLFYKKKVSTMPSGRLCSCFRTAPVSTRILICSSLCVGLFRDPHRVIFLP